MLPSYQYRQKDRHPHRCAANRHFRRAVFIGQRFRCCIRRVHHPASGPRLADGLAREADTMAGYVGNISRSSLKLDQGALAQTEVADEVRNLAQRSASSVQDTASLINSTVTRIKRGMSIVDELNERLKVIMESLTKIEALVGRIDQAADGQSASLSQVNQAMTEVDRYSQDTVGESGFMTGISADITEQVQRLREAIDMLGSMLNRK